MIFESIAYIMNPLLIRAIMTIGFSLNSRLLI